MTVPIQLVVEKGAQTGRVFAISADGVRIGRVSKNDIVVDDPMVSRFHCRILFKEDGSLWVSDLGSSNQTAVNNVPIQEVQLKNGDRVTVGDTVMRVSIGETKAPTAGESLPPPAVDLGLSPETAPTSAFRFSKQSLVILISLLTILFAGTATLVMLPSRNAAKAPPPPPPPKTLEVYYEKVDASCSNIFRYALAITADRKIAVEIDDTGKTHVHEDGIVGEDLVQDLASFIQDAEFFSLSEEYSGTAPDVLERAEISVVVGNRAHHVRVCNRVAPEAFTKVREKLEDFGKVELGIWAIQYSPDKLLAMAQDAWQLARKSYEEREIAPGNVAQALRSYKDAEFCLRTVDPKPSYYPEVLTGMTVCQEELAKRYDAQNFLATRAMKLKSWEDAARELRVLLEVIPDANDPRNQETRRRLLEVENRMKSRK
jgi:hypothetical protein